MLAATMTEEISKEEPPVTKICPPPSELCAIKKNIPCPEEGCSIIFFTSSHLDMHLLKHHKRNFNNKRKSGMNCQFHCPAEKCLYNMNSQLFFKSLKSLKQHYLKVHAKKSFQCVKCQKGFATEATMKHHAKSCGVKFTCSCNQSYISYEALLTHSKRKRHWFDEKYKLYGKALVSEVSDVENPTANNDCPTQTAIIIPVRLLAAVALSELSGKSSGRTTEKGVQTDACAADSKRSRKASSLAKACERATKRRMSAQTQTGAVGKWKQPKISAQTQTSGDSILMKAMLNANINVSPENKFFQSKSAIHGANKQRRKSMETQTIQKHQDANMYNLRDLQMETLDGFPSTADLSLTDNASSYRLGADVGIPDLWVNQKNSSGTQTSPVIMKSLIDHEELLNNTVTQTELNFALFETGSCEVNVNPDPDTSNIQRYFEDSSNCSFVEAAQVSTQNFGQDLGNESCQESTATLGVLTDDPGYSAVQMENILERNSDDVFGVNRSCNTETQTEVEITNSFLAECADGDTSFTLCSNIETQTTEDLPTFELPSSNMCTQTCDDVLFSALEFVNNETQTAWPQFATSDDSMFVSTETQTALSGCLSNYDLNSSNWFNSKASISETSHMETQTDIDEFRQLIAELSKQDSEDKLL